jgi:hypothetical protein
MKIRDENIDATSPSGIQLKAKGADRVHTAAETVRVHSGHCRVWKRISHQDARDVPDVSALVIAQFN